MLEQAAKIEKLIKKCFLHVARFVTGSSQSLPMNERLESSVKFETPCNKM